MDLMRSPHARALAAVVLWGGSFVATRLAVREVTPATLIAVRFALGLAVLLPALRRSRAPVELTAGDGARLLALGLLCIPVHQSLQANGLLLTTAGSMAWLVSLTPVFSALLARAFLRESLCLRKVAGILLAAAGAVLVASRGNIAPISLSMPATTGDLMAIASAFNWAVISVASKPLLRRLSPALMMTVIMLSGWLFFVPSFALHGWRELAYLSPAGWIAVLFLGVFCSGLAYLFWYQALAELEASQLACYIYLEPLVTVIVGAWLLGESLASVILAGGLLILLGVHVVNAAPRARPRPSPPPGTIKESRCDSVSEVHTGELI